ncbi:MAG: hypothetical protein DME71_14035 [Verrucomicrobia bacterium]|nr:MAG: hypothetical protein DME71_14035 [Verrucomicrobiota bacterium]
MSILRSALFAKDRQANNPEQRAATRLELVNRTVMLSEANIFLCFHAHWFRNNQRFFSRDCGIRMTL